MPAVDKNKDKRKEIIELLKIKEQWIAAIPKDEKKEAPKLIEKKKEESKGELADIVHEEQHNIEDALKDAPKKDEDDSKTTAYKGEESYKDESLYTQQHTGGVKHTSYHRHTTAQESYREAKKDKLKPLTHMQYDG